jgi:hypothetical protein
MAEWGFWEWLTYGCIGIAALMLALDAAVKQSPDLNARFGRLLASRLWAFTPFALILVSAVVIAVQHLSHPKSDTSTAAPVETAHPQQKEGLSDISVKAAAGPLKPRKRIFVGFGPKYLMEMDRKNTAAESEAILNLYAGKWIKVEKERFSGATRSSPELSSINRDPYVLVSVRLPGEYIVMCTLKDESQMETAMTTQPGTLMSFEGMITQRQTMLGAILSLDPCELR